MHTDCESVQDVPKLCLNTLQAAQPVGLTSPSHSRYVDALALSNTPETNVNPQYKTLTEGGV